MQDFVEVWTVCGYLKSGQNEEMIEANTSFVHIISIFSTIYNISRPL